MINLTAIVGVPASIQLGPQRPTHAWRFPSDPVLYQSLPADYDTAIAPFEVSADQNPYTQFQ
jgi:hypothetical protein